MKTVFKSMMLLAMTIYCSFIFAQTTTDFKSLKAKFLKMDDKYYVFLVDSQGNTYPNKSVTLTVKSNAVELLSPKIPVSPFQDNGFVLNKQPGNFGSLNLNFKLKDAQHAEQLRTTLDNKPQEKSGYLCPMHPTEIFQTEGVCSKCNMALVSKKISTYEVNSEKEKSKP